MCGERLRCIIEVNSHKYLPVLLDYSWAKISTTVFTVLLLQLCGFSWGHKHDLMSDANPINVYQDGI